MFLFKPGHDLLFVLQEEESNDKDHVNDGGHEVHSVPAAKDAENSKSESPFSTLVKMTTGKNPTTFSLPPELKCNTYFPGKSN
jgi:hypothetical protein